MNSIKSFVSAVASFFCARKTREKLQKRVCKALTLNIQLYLFYCYIYFFTIIFIALCCILFLPLRILNDFCISLARNFPLSVSFLLFLQNVFGCVSIRKLSLNTFVGGHWLPIELFLFRILLVTSIVSLLLIWIDFWVFWTKTYLEYERLLPISAFHPFEFPSILKLNFNLHGIFCWSCCLSGYL